MKRPRAVVAIAVGVAGAAVEGFTQGGWWPLLGAAVGAGAGACATVIGSRLTADDSAAEAVAEVCESLDRPLTGDAARLPGSLLLAEHRVVPFRGRRAEISAVTDWLADPGPRLMVLTGGVGVGKTRLSVELAVNPPPGWQVMRLRHGRAAGAVAALRKLPGNVLVVVEASERTSDFLADVAAVPAETPLRVIVIARTSSWLALLRSRLPETGVEMLDGAAELTLQPVGSHEDLARWYGEAVETFAATRGSDPISVGPVRKLGAGLTFGDLHARALVRALIAQPRTADARAAVGRVLADHERRQWPTPEGVRVDAVVRDQCVAVLTLLGVPGEPALRSGTDARHEFPAVDAETAAAQLLKVVPDIAEDEQARRELARWVHHLYPGTPGGPGPDRAGVDDNWIGVPAPPLLAHHLLLDPFLPGDPLWTAVRSRVQPDRLSRVIGVLAAAAAVDRDHASLLLTDLIDVHRDTAWLESLLLAGDTGPVDQLLEHLIRYERFGDADLVRFEEILDATEFPYSVLELGRRRLSLARASSDRLRLVTTLRDQIVALHRVGRNDEALAAATEVVALCRRPAIDLSARRPELAHAVERHAVALFRVGRYDDALLANEEATVLWHELAAADPRAHLPELACAVGNHATTLVRVGHYDKALLANLQVIAIWRELAAVDLEAHQQDLARAVVNYAQTLHHVGRYEDAVIANEEAIRLWRGLAAADPALQPELARAVANYAIALHQVGRYDDALAADEEAVRLWRELAAANPALHQPGLADAVRGHAHALDQVGRYPESLTAHEKAVALWRPLADADPAVHRPELARTVASHAVALARVGRDAEFLTVSQEAVELWRELATRNPTVHRSPFGVALRNHAVALARVGRDAEALAGHEQAVELWRGLAADNPQLHRPGLADALRNHAAMLEQVGRVDEAADTVDRAVDLWRALAEEHDYHESSLASALQVQHEIRRRVGREGEAVGKF